MTRPINIIALVPYPVYPAKMGGQKGIALFYKYLSALVPVTIISTKNNEFPATSAIKFDGVLGNNKWRYINILLFFKSKKLIKQHAFTHLILEHPYYGWLGILLHKFCDISLVVHSHNIESLRFKSTGRWWWRILYQYERMTHRHADMNFFITDEDRQYAIGHFDLEEKKCATITYGIELNEAPSAAERSEAKKILQQTHHINNNERILLFNGTLDYGPNLDALDVILEHINPLLLSSKKIAYKIIICGKNLPSKYDDLKKYASKNIIYAGFVEDIDLYFNGADIFLNPLVDGGGIKTKLVEALGYNLSGVSTKSGAIGIPLNIVEKKLDVCANHDWQMFTNLIINVNRHAEIPPAFFDYFYWGNIANKAVSHLSEINILKSHL